MEEHNEETPNDSAERYWTAERVDRVIKQLKAEYPQDAEDTEVVCILFEYKKLLRQLEERV